MSRFGCAGFRRSPIASALRRGLVPLLLLGLLPGCGPSSPVPLAAVERAPLDTALVGLWVPAHDSSASPLLVLAFNEREYLVEELPPGSHVVRPGHGCDSAGSLDAGSGFAPLMQAVLLNRRRAYTTVVDGATFWNLQDLVELPDERGFRFARFRRSAAGELRVRSVMRLPAPEQLTSSQTLLAWLQAHAAEDSIYASPEMVYRKVDEQADLELAPAERTQPSP